MKWLLFYASIALKRWIGTGTRLGEWYANFGWNSPKVGSNAQPSALQPSVLPLSYGGPDEERTTNEYSLFSDAFDIVQSILQLVQTGPHTVQLWLYRGLQHGLDWWLKRYSSHSSHIDVLVHTIKLITVDSRYYDTDGIRKMYRYNQTIDITSLNFYCFGLVGKQIWFRNKQYFVITDIVITRVYCIYNIH
jgi:hypothetical protein